MFLGWIEGHWTFIELMLKKIFESMLILVIGWWIVGVVTRSIKNIMLKAKVDAGIVSFIMSILKIVLRIIVLLSVADHIGIPTASLITALGAAAVTAGLAIKDSLSNVASGVLIIVNRMFSVGDYLKVENVEGTVKKIEIFFTTLATADNKQILIPNSRITSNNIINYTACEKRRLDLSYKVDYGSDLEKAKILLSNIISQNEKFLKDPACIVEVGEYRKNGIDVVVKVWCKTNEYSELYSYMQREVKNEFDKNGIVLSSNKIDISLSGGEKNVF